MQLYYYFAMDVITGGPQENGARMNSTGGENGGCKEMTGWKILGLTSSTLLIVFVGIMAFLMVKRKVQIERKRRTIKATYRRHRTEPSDDTKVNSVISENDYVDPRHLSIYSLVNELPTPQEYNRNSYIYDQILLRAGANLTRNLLMKSAGVYNSVHVIQIDAIAENSACLEGPGNYRLSCIRQQRANQKSHRKETFKNELQKVVLERFLKRQNQSMITNQTDEAED